MSSIPVDITLAVFAFINMNYLSKDLEEGEFTAQDVYDFIGILNETGKFVVRNFIVGEIDCFLRHYSLIFMEDTFSHRFRFTVANIGFGNKEKIGLVIAKYIRLNLFYPDSVFRFIKADYLFEKVG